MKKYLTICLCVCLVLAVCALPAAAASEDENTGFGEWVFALLTLGFGVLCCIAYHKIFDVVYFGGGGLWKELVACGFAGAILASITLSVWYITAGILVITGVVMWRKRLSIVPLIIFAAIAVVIAIVGINYKP